MVSFCANVLSMNGISPTQALEEVLVRKLIEVCLLTEEPNGSPLISLIPNDGAFVPVRDQRPFQPVSIPGEAKEPV